MQMSSARLSRVKCAVPLALLARTTASPSVAPVTYRQRPGIPSML